MAVYLAVASILLLLALLEVGTRRRWCAAIALIIVTAFAALRYETGFDWISYKWIFEEAPTVVGFLRGEPLNPNSDLLVMEDTYLVLNSVVRSFTDNIIVLFSLISVFTILAIHQVTGKLSRSQCLVWLVYFCLVFLAVQMSSIRSAISSSIVLIGLMLAARQHPVSGLMTIGIATAFHSVSAVFLPLPLLRNWRPSGKFVLLILTVGLVAFGLGLQPTDPLIDFISPYLPSAIAAKLISFYRGLEPTPISMGTYVLILGQLSLLLVFYRSPSEKDQRDPALIIAIWLTIAMVSAHLLLAGFPAVWNRLMYVALPWQIASMCRTDIFTRLSVAAKRFIVCGLGSVSIAGLVYFLVSPASLPFIPYRSVVQVWLTGDPGDGEERSLQWYAIVGNPFTGRLER